MDNRKQANEENKDKTVIIESTEIKTDKDGDINTIERINTIIADEKIKSVDELESLDDVKEVENNDNAEIVSTDKQLEEESPYKLVTITLPDDFKEQMEQAFDDEFSISQEKWGIRLNTRDKELIKHHTRGQLIQKVKDITYNDWNIDDSVISIRVVAEDEDEIISDVSICEKTFTPSFMADKLIVFNVTKGYTIVNIPTRKTVKMKDFYDYFTNILLTWLRTGVFYGVASYSS